jgi:hypothetical protein
MNKLILSIIGIVGLTSISWGQSAGGINYGLHIWPSSGPRTNLFFAGFPGLTSGVNGSWKLSSSLTQELNNTGSLGNVYTNSAGHRLTTKPTFGFELITNNTWSGPNPTRDLLVAFTGSLFAIPYSGPFVSYTNDLAVGWDDGSQGAGNAYTNGMFLPQEEETGTVGVFVDQAEELNVGLTYRDGQWLVE